MPFNFFVMRMNNITESPGWLILRCFSLVCMHHMVLNLDHASADSGWKPHRGAYHCAAALCKVRIQSMG